MTNKICPKCGKEIPKRFFFHKECGWSGENKDIQKDNEQKSEVQKEVARTTEEIVSGIDKIGVISSPSTNRELTIDILNPASQKGLVGQLIVFQFFQDNLVHYALGQLTQLKLKNVWIEEPTMRSLIRQKGIVNPVSGQQDTHIGQLVVSAVFSEKLDSYEPSDIGTVPPTGTFVHLANDQVLDSLLKQKKNEIFYLGYVYGTKTKLPLWFKHFGAGPQGAGEAYHLGVFGKTGSGKSALTKMILLAYARYLDMAIFVIDPQGEFSNSAKGKVLTEGFPLNLEKCLLSLGKDIIVKGVGDLVLDKWELFSEVLSESLFFERLSIPEGENRLIASRVLVEQLKKAKIKLEDICSHNVFDSAWKILGQDRIQKIFYRSQEARSRFASVYNTINPQEFFINYWKPVAELFSKRKQDAISIDELLALCFDHRREKRPVVIIDLSKETAKDLYWNDTIQSMVIKRLLECLVSSGENAYRENRFLNALVILDESHRFAPRQAFENKKQEDLRLFLLDSIRTTRKYGLGWMFISQTLSSLHKEIVNQMRIQFFGYGLGMGTEFLALNDIVGGEFNSLKLYQSFRDPHSCFDISSRQYPFMTVGPVSPLSFAGTPLFFNVYNNPEEFLKANGLLIEKQSK